jgi:hypothetical protein
MCTERVVPLGIPNDYCNWTFHLYIKVSAIEAEDMMKSTSRMHCCNILEDHFEDYMIVLGRKFPVAFWALLLTLISATNPSGRHDCAFVQTSHLNHPLPPVNITGSTFTFPYMSTGVESTNTTRGAKKSLQVVH